MGSGLDPGYVALLGLADSFLKTGTDGVIPAIKCLRAIFHLNLPPFLQARTHLQLGIVLRRETRNVELARQHIEQAWLLSQDLPQITDVRCEAATFLTEMYCELGRVAEVKQILLKAMETSQTHQYWHCRLLFLASSVHAAEKDYDTAVNFLTMGVDYAFMASASYTRMLFLLTKAMLYLLQRKFADANPILHETGPMIEVWVQNNTHQTDSVAKQQKEYLQIFFLVLQVCYYLMVGQVKSVKTVLKQLQQSIQTITTDGWPADDEMISTNPADHFRWLPKDQLCILVYLITVMHSMQAGYMDKAQKYTDKAVAQIEKLKSFDTKDKCRLFPPTLLSSIHVLLMEHIIQCRLVTGNKAGAIKELGNLCRLLEGDPPLLMRHRAQLHTMLGLYAMSMNCMEAAESQFNAALRTSQERELWTFANLNLAIVYLRSRRESDFMLLLDRIAPERLPSQSRSLQAAAYYIQGLHAFFTAKFNDSKRYLRETLKMANAEDVNRLTSCSLVLLGHIFLSLGNSRESMNMVTPAMQLASKIPDAHVQLWASSILKDLYRMSGDHTREQEASATHANFTQTLIKEHLSATELPEHNLINWTEGSFTFLSSNN